LFSFQPERQLRRVYAMSYIPADICRIIGDENVMWAVECLFTTSECDNFERLQQICNSHLKVHWIVWQTGIELIIGGHSVFLLKQFFSQTEIRDLDYAHLNIRTRDEQKRWRTFPIEQYAVIETLFPALR
uniref:NR LBD domain-containing protein n=1 Tax=Angiostrongylus cantonensis TaxID=6313 RepID=A0A0K0D872_ANGCA